MLISRRSALTLALVALCAASTPSAQAGSARSCDPIINPYPDTRYEGTDLRRIRAVGVACRSARPLVRGAHRKALGMTPPESGVRRFTYRGWRVKGDLRGSSDRYVATRGARRIRWVF